MVVRAAFPRRGDASLQVSLVGRFRTVVMAGSRIRTWWFVVVAVGGLAPFAACGSSGEKAPPPSRRRGPPPPSGGTGHSSPASSGGLSAWGRGSSASGQPVGKGYLATDNLTWAAFIQW